MFLSTFFYCFYRHFYLFRPTFFTREIQSCCHKYNTIVNAFSVRIPNLMRERGWVVGIKYTTSGLRILESYTCINLCPRNVSLNLILLK